MAVSLPDCAHFDTSLIQSLGGNYDKSMGKLHPANRFHFKDGPERILGGKCPLTLKFLVRPHPLPAHNGLLSPFELEQFMCQTVSALPLNGEWMEEDGGWALGWGGEEDIMDDKWPFTR